MLEELTIRLIAVILYYHSPERFEILIKSVWINDSSVNQMFMSFAIKYLVLKHLLDM